MALNPPILAIPHALHADPDPTANIDRYLTSLAPFQPSHPVSAPTVANPGVSTFIDPRGPEVVWDKPERSGGGNVGASSGTERVLTRKEMLAKYRFVPEEEQDDEQRVRKEVEGRGEAGKGQQNDRRKKRDERKDINNHLNPDSRGEKRKKSRHDGPDRTDPGRRHPPEPKHPPESKRRARSPSIESTESALRRRERKLRRRENAAIVRPPRQASPSPVPETRKKVGAKKRQTIAPVERLLQKLRAETLDGHRLTLPPRKSGLFGKAVTSKPIRTEGFESDSNDSDDRGSHSDRKRSNDAQGSRHPTTKSHYFSKRSQGGRNTLHELAAGSGPKASVHSGLKRSTSRSRKRYRADSAGLSEEKDGGLPQAGITGSPPWPSSGSESSQTIRGGTTNLSQRRETEIRPDPRQGRFEEHSKWVPAHTHASALARTRDLTPFSTPGYPPPGPRLDDTWTAALHRAQAPPSHIQNMHDHLRPPLHSATALPVTPGPWAGFAPHSPSPSVHPSHGTNDQGVGTAVHLGGWRPPTPFPQANMGRLPQDITVPRTYPVDPANTYPRAPQAHGPLYPNQPPYAPQEPAPYPAYPSYQPYTPYTPFPHSHPYPMYPLPSTQSKPVPYSGHWPHPPSGPPSHRYTYSSSLISDPSERPFPPPQTAPRPHVPPRVDQVPVFKGQDRDPFGEKSFGHWRVPGGEGDKSFDMETRPVREGEAEREIEVEKYGATEEEWTRLWKR